MEAESRLDSGIREHRSEEAATKEASRTRDTTTTKSQTRPQAKQIGEEEDFRALPKIPIEQGARDIIGERQR